MSTPIFTTASASSVLENAKSFSGGSTIDWETLNISAWQSILPNEREVNDAVIWGTPDSIKTVEIQDGKFIHNGELVIAGPVFLKDVGTQDSEGLKILVKRLVFRNKGEVSSSKNISILAKEASGYIKVYGISPQDGADGNDGANGSKGGNGSAGGQGGDGRAASCAVFHGHGCSGGGDGSRGSNGDRGYDGGDGAGGANGNNSPDITVHAYTMLTFDTVFQLKSNGSNGGDGGDGGNGGQGGDGGTGGGGGNGGDSNSNCFRSACEGGAGGRGGNAGDGGDGGDGGAAGNGGNSGNLQLTYRLTDSDVEPFAELINIPGNPGNFGRGGLKGLRGNVGKGGRRGRGGKGGIFNGTGGPGEPGGDGLSGEDGRDGRDGQAGVKGNQGLKGKYVLQPVDDKTSFMLMFMDEEDELLEELSEVIGRNSFMQLSKILGKTA